MCIGYWFSFSPQQSAECDSIPIIDNGVRARTKDASVVEWRCSGFPFRNFKYASRSCCGVNCLPERIRISDIHCQTQSSTIHTLQSADASYSCIDIGSRRVALRPKGVQYEWNRWCGRDCGGIKHINWKPYIFLVFIQSISPSDAIAAPDDIQSTHTRARLKVKNMDFEKLFDIRMHPNGCWRRV